MGIDTSIAEKIISDFKNRSIQELKSRIVEYKPDMTNAEVYSVLGSLISRQTTLAIELAGAPQIWNGHSAPLFHRAMADVYITMAWILGDATSRSKKYIEHGLGQAVLQLEHQRAANGTKAVIDNLEAWINEQKWSFLIDVNVGSWSEKTTRKMAEEAGCLEFYNYVYVPFSHCAHSTWYHLGRYNAERAENPLHRHILVPSIVEVGSDFNELLLVAKYLDKAFNLFDKEVLKKVENSNLRDWLVGSINAAVPIEESEI